jgi:hypothetical protein
MGVSFACVGVGDWDSLRCLRLVNVVEVANADYDHIGFGLDDAHDEMPEGVQKNRANHSARLRAGHVPQFLLQHRGDQHRAVGADDQVLEEIVLQKVGDRVSDRRKQEPLSWDSPF